MYEKLEKLTNGNKRLASFKISPNIKKYKNKQEYKLDEVIEFALQERFISLN